MQKCIPDTLLQRTKMNPGRIPILAILMTVYRGHLVIADTFSSLLDQFYLSITDFMKKFLLYSFKNEKMVFWSPPPPPPPQSPISQLDISRAGSTHRETSRNAEKRPEMPRNVQKYQVLRILKCLGGGGGGGEGVHKGVH